MSRLLYTHRKGELKKLKRQEAAKPAYREARRLNAIAQQTQSTASQTANNPPSLRKSNRPREAS